MVLGMMLLSLLSASASERKARPVLPIDGEFDSADRHDFKWRVEVFPPALTFQQRMVLRIEARVSTKSLMRASETRDLHFLAKIADAAGHWYPEESYVNLPVAPQIDRDAEVIFTTAFFLRPGKYTAAVACFDRITGQWNLVHKAVDVVPLKVDPLPQLDRGLPAVEVIQEPPTSADMSRMLPSVEQALWPVVGQGKELPLAGPPVQVDIVLNFAGTLDASLTRPAAGGRRRENQARLLQIGSVLSRLQPSRGCARVSGLDIAAMKVLFDRSDAEQVEWPKMALSLKRGDEDTIEATALANSAGTATFFRNYLMRLRSDSGECHGSGAPLRRAVIVVSSSLEFPHAAAVKGLPPEEECDCRFYYLRTIETPVQMPRRGSVFVSRSAETAAGPPPGVLEPSPFDDVDRVLMPFKARRYEVRNPLQLRNALAEVMNDIGRAENR